MTKSIGIIEDQANFREALESIIGMEEDYHLVGSYFSLETALRGFQQGDKPDVLLLDIHLPGKSGLEGLPQLRQLMPNCCIIILTLSDERHVVFEAISAGASGYLLKSASFEEILEGIKEVLNGGAPLNAKIAKMLLSTFQREQPDQNEEQLTDREKEILGLFTRGLIKKEIANELNISYHTVNTHIKNIYKKLQVSNISAATMKAVQKGLIS